MQDFQRNIPGSEMVDVMIEGLNEQDPPEYPELPNITLGTEIAIKAVADAIGSGMNGMMKEGIESFEQYKDGKIDQKQYTYRVIYKGTQSAVKSGTRTAAALGISEGVKRMVAKQFGKELVKRLGKANFITSMAFGVVDQTSHVYDFYQGKMSAPDLKVKSVENVGSTGGAISGAAVGAMLGSAVPGLGTVSGAMLGYMFAVIGSMSGASLGKSLGEQWFKEEDGGQTPASPANGAPIDIPIE